MNIEVNLNKLISIVDKASRATGKNLSLPILSCILLKADSSSNNLNIKSTNLDIGVDFNLSIKCKNSGSVAVPANIFLNFLSSIKSDVNINIVEKDGNLHLNAKNNKSVIKCFNVEDFPEIPKVDTSKKCNIKSTEFLSGLKNVWYSASTSSIKPELSSVYIYSGNQELIFVATDSFRLAEKTILFQKLNTEKSITLLVPGGSVLELLRLLDLPKESIVSLGDEKEVSIVSNKNQIIFQNSRIRFISRLTEGSFPDYEQIIPKNFKAEALIKQKDLINQIKLASVFVGRLQDIILILQPKNKKLLFQVSNPDIGEHESELEISVNGEENSAKFNWKYLFDGINHVSTEYVVLGFNGDQSPLMIKGKGDTSYYYLAMPMRGM